jgi:hypothetical protein
LGRTPVALGPELDHPQPPLDLVAAGDGVHFSNEISRGPSICSTEVDRETPSRMVCCALVMVILLITPARTLPGG